MNCLRCGYDLSHTAYDRPCPECGLAAERSLTESVRPDDARPRWVWSIATATLLLLLAYLMPVAAAGVATAEAADEVMLAPLLLLAAAALLHWIANVMLSRDDRRRPQRWWQSAHRWSLRLLPLGPVLASAAGIILLTAVNQWPPPTIFAQIVVNHLALFELVIGVLGGLFIICPTLSFLRLRWLALRLERRRLAEHIGIVAVGSGLAMAACIFAALPAGQIIRHSGAPFTLLVVLPIGLFILFTLWSVALLFVICPLFFRSALHARAKWKAADAARIGTT